MSKTKKLNLFKLTFFFAMLAVITLFCHTFVERYERIGPDMLTNNWHSSLSKGAVAKIANNELYLFSKDNSSSVQIKQEILNFEPGNILMLSADIKYSNVVPGEKPWNQARLLLIQYDKKNGHIISPHAAAGFDGTGKWDRYSKAYITGKDTNRIQITAVLSQCTGSFQLKKIHLYPVSQNKVYSWIQRIVLFCWAMFAVFLLRACFYNGSMIIFKILLAISFIAIIAGTTMPQEMRTHVSQEVRVQLQETSDVFQNGFAKDISKLGHFGFFALFGFLLCLLMGKNSIGQVMYILLLSAAGSELAQFFIDGRPPLVIDFFIDIAGGGSGLTLSSLIPRKALISQ
jgi:VanZ like family